MTRDDIIHMARKAGIGPVYGNDSIERFAALVAAQEREACERLAWDTPDNEETGIRTAIALAIHVRGEA